MYLGKEPTRALEIFFCYAREDEEFLKGLEKQLRALKRQRLIDVWYDRDISAGMEWEREIDKHLHTAQIILLLVSPDFMDSDYCYSVEMTKALERHARGEACVIPVILRRVHWQDAPFSKLQVLPTGGIPITHWADRDEAFWNVAVGILDAVKELKTNIEANSLAKKPQILSSPTLSEKETREASSITTMPQIVPPIKSNSHTFVGEATDRVVVVPARKALPEYLKCSAYICQPYRHFQDCVRLAFYTNNKIYRKVPKILGQVEAIPKDEIETRTDLSEVDRARLRDILRTLDTETREIWRQQLKVVFLSTPDSAETLVLPQDIENDLTASTGRGVAFTQGQRYVSLSRLEKGPKRTSELV